MWTKAAVVAANISKKEYDRTKEREMSTGKGNIVCY